VGLGASLCPLHIFSIALSLNLHAALRIALASKLQSVAPACGIVSIIACSRELLRRLPGMTGPESCHNSDPKQQFGKLCEIEPSHSDAPFIVLVKSSRVFPSPATLRGLATHFLKKHKIVKLVK
jgi:hypothetical protein